MMFSPTRAAGLSRLTEFIPKAGREYSQLRNSDMGVGQHNYVSRLSPCLRHRLITEREVVDAAIQAYGPAQCEKFIQEVFWRTYFKGRLEHQPHIWKQYQDGVEASLKPLTKDKALRASYEDALSGQTGIACFDHWRGELIGTGYLHNHARMWFASIWIFTLKLPWELGADFFIRHLIDGDPASNTLSWRWVAGLHTKGKIYLARPDNIKRFTNGRFNPQGQLAEHAEPLIEPDDLMTEQNLPQTDQIPDRPFLLLVHEDDCHPENLLPAGAAPKGVIGGVATSRRSPLAVDEKITAFARGAVKDALDRFDSNTPPMEQDWTAPLIKACEHHGVKNIVTAYTPVGPSAEALKTAAIGLNKADITVSQIIRPWDSIIWPYANRGFFKVKKKMPKILEALEQTS
ncbi:MAG: FAD-binding domain-containing protein [Hellea sp.]